ncbi:MULTISPECIES: polysaccharide pyruvyl transferase family protein [Bifidobacterium]|uniref:polysaccharide pyruvyl transferase family protein n=1 Tax=Bifidobacterium TaxID=1678 RepID=UPI001BDC711D|nr:MULTISPECIES: polysaccharide pyruvyl transferase family protein [Bifidobacterium]MBT1161022.1 polysaccharide pyruvyl transferase family protein [Bifidobacterium sp. SO1]MBW3079552.1 polysaccharide pyruvyl transferase family protein [Bifidobacterium simiiventris]
MIRLWILTINDEVNYGNRLQNYALTDLLHSYSSSVNTISYQMIDENVFAHQCRLMLRPIKRTIKRLSGRNGALQYRQLVSFKEFAAEFKKSSILSLSMRKGLSRPVDNNDIFVIGSDQVWNNSFDYVTDDMIKMRLGCWFPAYRFISYAASFGIDQVNPASKPIFSKYFPRFSSISVREDRAVALVKELSGCDADVVLDPTLMMSADRWKKVISDNFVPVDEKFVLTYFLGKPTSRQEEVIQHYANEHGCKVRRLLDFDDPETFIAGPREFVELFSKAQYVFTDSYHACCFSIIFNKQFKVFNRAGFSGKGNMNSRMQTLFRLFELDDLMDDDTKLSYIDYAHVNRLLKKHRKESREWLDSAMSKVGVVASR